MFKNVSKLHISLSFLMVIICFLQAFNHWGDRLVSSLVYLFLGVLLLILTVAVIRIKKRN